MLKEGTGDNLLAINNDWLGSEGSKAWDGTNNEGDKVPVGIYIVYFEVI